MAFQGMNPIVIYVVIALLSTYGIYRFMSSKPSTINTYKIINTSKSINTPKNIKQFEINRNKRTLGLID